MNNAKLIPVNEILVFKENAFTKERAKSVCDAVGGVLGIIIPGDDLNALSAYGLDELEAMIALAREAKSKIPGTNQPIKHG